MIPFGVQGYKSKDSKRQNADIDNATVAWANDYLPVFAIFSSQIDSDIVLRYRNNRCGILIGTTNGNDKTSLYAFCAHVLGYDLADFFKRHTNDIKKAMEQYGVLYCEFDVYADFKEYKSGIYYQTSNNLLGQHAVKLLGWGTENVIKYWIFQTHRLFFYIWSSGKANIFKSLRIPFMGFGC